MKRSVFRKRLHDASFSVQSEIESGLREMEENKRKGANNRHKGTFVRKASVTLMSLGLSAVLAAGPLIIEAPGPSWTRLLGPSKVYAATQNGAKMALIGEQIVSSGVTLQQYVWHGTRNKTAVQSNVNVLKIDLRNPYVKLDVMTGRGGQFTTRQSVRGMAAETGALAGVNGDFYSMSGEGAPLGGQMSGGQLMSSPSQIAGMYALVLTKNNEPIIDRFAFQGNVVSEGGYAQYPLAGVNKAVYWTDPDRKHSHVDAIHLYTSAWGSKSRANDGMTTPTEVLVQNGVVVQISDKKALDMVPPSDGYILRASGKAAQFLTENFKAGDRIYTDYRVVPLSGSSAYDISNFEMMLGGHTILVENGKAAQFSRDVRGIDGNAHRSRTAAGYSQDGRYLYLITVDTGGDSKGMNLAELQQTMIQLGVWKGLNLDGGGSTQMVARPLGDKNAILVNKPENGTARQVVNGLGVYSTAPQGQLAGMFIQGEDILFLGEKKILQLKAYDEYYNPLEVDPATLTWTASNDVGAFDGPKLTALQPGTVKVTASGGLNAESSKEITIVGRKDVDSLVFQSRDFVLTEGDVIELPALSATTKGIKRTVPAELLEWEFYGFEGTVDPASRTVTVGHVSGSEPARIIARYDGMGAMMTGATGTEMDYMDFSGRNAMNIVHSVTPSAIGGYVSIVQGLKAEQPDNAVLQIEYNFMPGTGTKAVYAEFEGGPVQLEGAPSRMELDVLGDNSLNWLRAEFVDAAGKTHYVDLANPVNWTGWKRVSADLESYNMAYPVSLKRFYVANPEIGQDERAAVGAVAIDDVSLVYKSVPVPLPKAQVQMAVGRKAMTVNGEEQQLEVAPKVENDTTLIPVRFFIDAMGGDVLWDAESKRVSIIRDDHLIELWIDDPSVVIDGKRVEAAVAPTLVNNRTMLPLRLISEALGWKVGWDQETRSITLE